MKDNSKLLLATGVGLILSDVIPTPADALYFKYQQKWKGELEDGLITPKQYWTKDAIAYYGLNPIWWSIVLATSLTFGKTYEQKLGIFVAMLSGGAIVGVINKNIKKDIQRYGTE